MSKAHRGRPLKEETPGAGRGYCPVTKKTGVKLLYEVEIDGQKVMVSKAGKATLDNARRRKEHQEQKQEAATAEE
jgi:hypothetical protein